MSSNIKDIARGVGKFLYHSGLGVCGCAEVGPVLVRLREYLRWLNDVEGRPAYFQFADEIGDFYLIVTLLEREGLAEHGISTRCAFITERGRELLALLELNDDLTPLGEAIEAMDLRQ